MKTVDYFLRRVIFFSIVTASISFLYACVSSPSAPPPYVPYESKAGEAANVRKVLDSMQKNRHSDAPKSRRSASSSAYTDLPRHPANTTSSSAYPRSRKSPANLVITNKTKCKLGFYLQGPTTREFGIEPGKYVKVDITAGSYQFGIDTHLCVGKVPPLLGKDVYESGSSYTLTISQEDIQRKMGDFVVKNNTGAKLTVRVGGEMHTVVPGSFSIELPEGSYTAAISARCGVEKDSFDITNGSTYIAKYWCTGGEIIRRPPQVGYFNVDNSTGATLTVNVGGRSYKVPPGSTTIELSEGSYTAKISARCGSTNEDLEISQGSQYEGSYSCVTY